MSKACLADLALPPAQAAFTLRVQRGDRAVEATIPASTARAPVRAASARVGGPVGDQGAVRVRSCPVGLLLLGGDKAGNWQRWYRENIPLAEQLYQEYTEEEE